MKRSITVFVSSSMTGEMDYEREVVKETIEAWRGRSWFFELLPASNDSPSRACREGVRECGILVLLLGAELRRAVLDEYEEAVRCDKPILAFVRAPGRRDGSLRSVASSDGVPSIEQFLKEIDAGQPAALRRATVLKEFVSLRQLRDELDRALDNELSKQVQHPSLALNDEQMYSLGAHVIRESDRRLCVFESTPSLILGPREYGTDEGVARYHELEYCTVLRSWITAHATMDASRMLYLFDGPATGQAFASVGASLRAGFARQVRERIDFVRDAERRSGGRLRFRCVRDRVAGPLIVGDDLMAFSFIAGRGRMSVSHRDRGLCDALVQWLPVSADDHATDEFLGRLYADAER